MKQLNNEIIKVLKYFSIFAYYPTLDEIYTFLPVKIDKNKLKYTPPQYSIPTSLKLRGASKYQISKKKLENWKFKTYIKLLSLTPQIKLVGLSGSISMMNAKEDDDIDLFIITIKNRLFTGRLIALVLAQMLGLRRVRDSATHFFHKNKVCLNLFFDEGNLKVPPFKQTEFVGHEVLQMKPIVVKGNVYERFLGANRWVFRLFPNAPPVIPAKAGIQTKITSFIIFNKVEQLLKKIQLKLINKHRTTEIITPTQLWFHPDDFEKKLKLQ
ncbi:MAG: hypothetical protein AAB569_06295 [Patescibacteria group bacterium]